MSLLRILLSDNMCEYQFHFMLLIEYTFNWMYKSG